MGLANAGALARYASTRGSWVPKLSSEVAAVTAGRRGDDGGNVPFRQAGSGDMKKPTHFSKEMRGPVCFTPEVKETSQGATVMAPSFMTSKVWPALEPAPSVSQ